MPHSGSTRLRVPRALRALAASALFVPSGFAGAQDKPQLSLRDTRADDGAVEIATGDWKIVFSAFFNGGIHQWFDLSSDPDQSDNISTEQTDGNYNQGTLFDYDVYLGSDPSRNQEFMTTMGRNADPGSLDFRVLENTPTRVRILQKGHPRLNNGRGPAGDPFIELSLVAVETIWTLYPTGKVGIEFRADRNEAGALVDSGPGGNGKGVMRLGSDDRVLEAVGGADFLQAFAVSGDTIESPSGAFGPNRIIERISPTQLRVQDPVPAGVFDYAIRRNDIQLETISIHADGDPLLVRQCSDPAVSRWQGGSNEDRVWDSLPSFDDPCRGLFASEGRRSNDVILAHWATDRPVGSTLVFFEPWLEANGGFFNDVGFTDISFTQLGRSGLRPFEPLHRHFLAQMGSAASQGLPTIQSVADAEPFGLDYRAPFAEALIGELARGEEIASFGFNPGTASYEIEAETNRAVIRFDASGAGRSALAYKAPAVTLTGLSLEGELRVELSRDGGNRFEPLSDREFTLTSAEEEGQTGQGRRVFQLLGDVPASATGASAWALRFSPAGSAGE